MTWKEEEEELIILRHWELMDSIPQRYIGEFN